MPVKRIIRASKNSLLITSVKNDKPVYGYIKINSSEEAVQNTNFMAELMKALSREMKISIQELIREAEDGVLKEILDDVFGVKSICVKFNKVASSDGFQSNLDAIQAYTGDSDIILFDNMRLAFRENKERFLLSTKMYIDNAQYLSYFIEKAAIADDGRVFAIGYNYNRDFIILRNDANGPFIVAYNMIDYENDKVIKFKDITDIYNLRNGFVIQTIDGNRYKFKDLNPSNFAGLLNLVHDENLFMNNLFGRALQCNILSLQRLDTRDPFAFDDKEGIKSFESPKFDEYEYGYFGKIGEKNGIIYFKNDAGINKCITLIDNIQDANGHPLELEEVFIAMFDDNENTGNFWVWGKIKGKRCLLLQEKRGDPLRLVVETHNKLAMIENISACRKWRGFQEIIVTGRDNDTRERKEFTYMFKSKSEENIITLADGSAWRCKDGNLYFRYPSESEWQFCRVNDPKGKKMNVKKIVRAGKNTLLISSMDGLSYIFGFFNVDSLTVNKESDPVVKSVKSSIVELAKRCVKENTISERLYDSLAKIIVTLYRDILPVLDSSAETNNKNKIPACKIEPVDSGDCYLNLLGAS
jgi:hypothetical protein